MKTAIRKHLIDFLAVLGLVLISAVVAVEILSNQRLTLPAWVPVVGKDFYEIEAELSTAQAVTPGQGTPTAQATARTAQLRALRSKIRPFGTKEGTER